MIDGVLAALAKLTVVAALFTEVAVSVKVCPAMTVFGESKDVVIVIDGILLTLMIFDVTPIKLLAVAWIVVVPVPGETAVTAMEHGVATPADILITQVDAPTVAADGLFDIMLAVILLVPSTGTGETENATVVDSGVPPYTSVGVGCDVMINCGCVTAKTTLDCDNTVPESAILVV